MVTADVKSTLTETLRAHRETNIEPLRNGDYRISCDGCSWRSDEESAVAACDAHDGHLADVLLGLSGVAVTALPEPDPDADPELYDASFKFTSDDEYARGARTPRVCIDASVPEVYTICAPTSHISANEARSYAAALLAAAAVVSEGER